METDALILLSAMDVSVVFGFMADFL